MNLHSIKKNKQLAIIVYTHVRLKMDKISKKGHEVIILTRFGYEDVQQTVNKNEVLISQYGEFSSL